MLEPGEGICLLDCQPFKGVRNFITTYPMNINTFFFMRLQSIMNFCVFTADSQRFRFNELLFLVYILPCKYYAKTTKSHTFQEFAYLNTYVHRGSYYYFLRSLKKTLLDFEPACCNSADLCFIDEANSRSKTSCYKLRSKFRQHKNPKKESPNSSKRNKNWIRKTILFFKR